MNEVYYRQFTPDGQDSLSGDIKMKFCIELETFIKCQPVEKQSQLWKALTKFMIGMDNEDRKMAYEAIVEIENY